METTQTSGPWRAARAPQVAPNGPLQWRAENYLFLPKKRCFETNQGITLGGFRFIPEMFVQTDLRSHGYYQKR